MKTEIFPEMRIVSESISPDKISNILDISFSRSEIKGQLSRGDKGYRYEYNSWIYKLNKSNSYDLEDDFEELKKVVLSKSDNFLKLSQENDISATFFFALYLYEGCPSVILSKKNISFLNKYKIEFEIDLYNLNEVEMV